MKNGCKKWTSLMLAIMLISMLALTGCGNQPAETTAPKVPETTAPAVSETTAPTVADNCYIFSYQIETGADSDKNGRSEARANTYINGTSKNGDYNLLSVGAVGVMGLEGKTALTLNEDGTYVLEKTLVSAMVGVDIKYSFEGTYERTGDTVMLNPPTAASAQETIAAGMKSNGINPNYDALTTSQQDARILNWFATAYISYKEGEITPMAATVNDVDKTLVIESEEADEPEETQPQEKAEAILIKTLETPGSDGNMTAVNISFFADGTFAVDKGFGGTWSLEEGVPTSPEGTWDAESKTWTFSFYSGKVTLPYVLTEEDLTALAGEPDAVAEVKTSVGDKELLLTFYSDHTYKVTMSGMSINSGTWKIENRAIVTTQISGAEEKEPVVMNAEKTLVMNIGGNEVPFVLDNTALIAISSVG